MGDNAKDDAIELGGREFKRVKNGLDEAQVASFIDELINERDKLAQSQAHMASLTRLAEKTIAEADRLAEQIKAEAAEQAKAESAALMDKAKEQAQQMVEEKLAKAAEIANEKAKAIQSQAEEKAALLLENERKRTRDELSNFVSKQLGHLLKELESLEQKAAAAQADLDNKLSQLVQKSSTLNADSEEVISAANVAESEILGKTLEPTQAEDKKDKSFDLFELIHMKDQAGLGKPQLEVEILPPFDIAKLMKVVAYIDQLSEVKDTEIIPRTDKPSILVFLSEPINFVNVLGKIPGVAYIEEIKTDEDAANGGPRKVRIGLSENTTSQEKK